MIKLTLSSRTLADDTAVWIAPQHIIAVRLAPNGGSFVTTVNTGEDGGGVWMVDESPKAVARAISQSLRLSMMEINK